MIGNPQFTLLTLDYSSKEEFHIPFHELNVKIKMIVSDLLISYMRLMTCNGGDAWKYGKTIGMQQLLKNFVRNIVRTCMRLSYYKHL